VTVGLDEVDQVLSRIDAVFAVFREQRVDLPDLLLAVLGEVGRNDPVDLPGDALDEDLVARTPVSSDRRTLLRGRHITVSSA
jgi:hypothetical protein